MCIFRTCWSPGVRKTESVGTGNPGSVYGRKLVFDEQEVLVCTWMFDYGCPEEPEEDKELAVQRFEDGWVSSPL